MPIWTYTPQWDAVRAFYAKAARLIPKDYSGRAAIRLHRTGHPLALELFGRALPERKLPPMLFFELKGGKMTESWSALETNFDIPWARPEDFHAYRGDVMPYYHAEDLLEPAAEAVLAEANPSDEALRKVFFDEARAALAP